MAPERLRRLGAAGVALSAFVCPCHVLAGAAIAVSLVVSGTAPALSPELQDSVHSVYLPAAVLSSAWLLRPRPGRARSDVTST